MKRRRRELKGGNRVHLVGVSGRALAQKLRVQGSGDRLIGPGRQGNAE